MLCLRGLREVPNRQASGGDEAARQMSKVRQSRHRGKQALPCVWGPSAAVGEQPRLSQPQTAECKRGSSQPQSWNKGCIDERIGSSGCLRNPCPCAGPGCSPVCRQDCNLYSSPKEKGAAFFLIQPRILGAHTPFVRLLRLLAAKGVDVVA